MEKGLFELFEEYEEKQDGLELLDIEDSVNNSLGRSLDIAKKYLNDACLEALKDQQEEIRKAVEEYYSKMLFFLEQA